MTIDSKRERLSIQTYIDKYIHIYHIYIFAKLKTHVFYYWSYIMSWYNLVKTSWSGSVSEKKTGANTFFNSPRPWDALGGPCTSSNVACYHLGSRDANTSGKWTLEKASLYYPLQKIDECPLKRDHFRISKGTFVFKPFFFGSYVSFRGSKIGG